MIQVAEKLGETIGVAEACRVLGVPRSSLYRARLPKAEPAPRPQPERALSPEERAQVRAVLNSECFCDESPREVYAALLDDGIYHCHWRTMYRILEDHGEVHERRNQRQHPSYTRPELKATGPNQLWSWDITELKGPKKGMDYYLYVIIDVFSRYVVGWMIAETCAKEGIDPHQLTLHADRGSPMRSKTVAELLINLKVAKSHARPYTPTDNPYSEAHFKTLKYRPGYPDRFASSRDARHWAQRFFHWYNHEHYHSGLGLMKPALVHQGEAEAVYEQRQQVLDAAYRAHPERFVRGQPTPPPLPSVVWINQPIVHPSSSSAQRGASETQPGAQPGQGHAALGRWPPLTRLSTWLRWSRPLMGRIGFAFSTLISTGSCLILLDTFHTCFLLVCTRYLERILNGYRILLPAPGFATAGVSGL